MGRAWCSVSGAVEATSRGQRIVAAAFGKTEVVGDKPRMAQGVRGQVESE